MTITEVRAILRVCDLDGRKEVLLAIPHAKPRTANIEVLPDRPGVNRVRGKVLDHRPGRKDRGGPVVTVQVDVELMRQWVKQMEQVQ